MKKQLAEAARRVLGGHAPAGDGRNIAPWLGALDGEGAQMDTAPPAHPSPMPLDGGPARPSDATEGESYYGLPVLKAPVWKWYISAYFYLGGLAGGAAWAGACAQLAERKHLDSLIRRSRAIATSAIAGSAALLIADLGRPARFIHMLRVFRPTSPMNIGTWILSAAGAANGAAWLFDRRPAGRRIADMSGIVAGALGLPLSGYTAVLVTNTAIPVWQASRRTLPLLFIASGLTSAGAAFELFPRNEPEGRAVRALAISSKVAELAAGVLVDWEAARPGERVARPLREGISGALLRGSRWLTVASVVGSIVSRESRAARIAAGALGTLGALALRFAVLQAGRASARDPLATFEPQRRERRRRESELARPGARPEGLPGGAERARPPEADPPVELRAR